MASVGEGSHDGDFERATARRPTAAPRAVRDPSGHATSRDRTPPRCANAGPHDRRLARAPLVPDAQDPARL